MRKYVFIGCGGFTGAILRYLGEKAEIRHYFQDFPLNTLIINLSGAFLLALILTAAYEILKMDEDIRLGIATGFLGAFTTFSTLCKETIGLMRGGDYFLAIIYVTASAVLGLGAVCLGITASRKVLSKFLQNRRNSR